MCEYQFAFDDLYRTIDEIREDNKKLNEELNEVSLEREKIKEEYNKLLMEYNIVKEEKIHLQYLLKKEL